MKSTLPVLNTACLNLILALILLKCITTSEERVITVGSDAHEVKFFAYRFDVVADMLKNAGFNYYTIFNERKPEFIRL